MLSRPEIGTREHILLWLGSKKPDETYKWEKSTTCACGQYANEHRLGEPHNEGNGSFSYQWGSVEHLGGFSDNSLNHLAEQHPRTFGALYERADKAWR